MSHQHDIGASTPGSNLKDGRAQDMFALGIQKLREMARLKTLDRFHWPKAGGRHAEEVIGDDSPVGDLSDSQTNPPSSE